jgi:hypothetical protein
MLDLTQPKRPRGGQIGNQNHQTHGLTSLKRAVKVLGNRLIDGRTSIGKELARWRQDLIQDLGGNVSTQQLAVIDIAVKNKLILDSIDAWMLAQPTLVNKRKKMLRPIVLQRQQLADGLLRCMTLLGLERRIVELDLARRIQLEQMQQQNGK